MEKQQTNCTVFPGWLRKLHTDGWLVQIMSKILLFHYLREHFPSTSWHQQTEPLWPGIPAASWAQWSTHRKKTGSSFFFRSNFVSKLPVYFIFLFHIRKKKYILIAYCAHAQAQQANITVDKAKLGHLRQIFRWWHVAHMRVRR